MWWQDFKKFAFKGNIIDMAVGVVIGGAFGKIVTALVNNIITPLISLLVGRMNFSEMKWVITPAHTVDGVDVAENALLYGSFIQSVIDFFIIAFCIFIFLRILTKAKSTFEKKSETEESAPAPEAPTTEELLIQIRDLLQEKQK